MARPDKMKMDNPNYGHIRYWLHLCCHVRGLPLPFRLAHTVCGLVLSQVVSAIDPFESDTPALDMRSRPFMAMVTSDDTSHSQKRALFHRGVDAVFQTPLQSPLLAALVDFSHR